MARFTTIVAVVTEDASRIVEAVAADAMNVSAVQLETMELADELARRSTALREAERRKSVYTLIDFDPMEPVVEAWVARLAGEENHLDLEAGRIGKLMLPEYILVGDEIEDARVHWYYGHLRSYAARRVVTTEATPASVHRALTRLGSDRSFPNAHTIAMESLAYAPTGLSTTEPSRTALVQPTGH